MAGWFVNCLQPASGGLPAPVAEYLWRWFRQSCSFLWISFLLFLPASRASPWCGMLSFIVRHRVDRAGRVCYHSFESDAGQNLILTDTGTVLCAAGPAKKERIMMNYRIRVFCLLVAVLLFVGGTVPACLNTASAWAGEISNSNDFLASLSAYRITRTEKFSISLTESYFNSLSGNNFHELSILLLKAGIQDYHMQYTTRGDLYLDSVQWTEPHVADCAAEEEFEEALRDFLKQNIPAFQFVIRSNALYDSLFNQGRLHAYAAMYGAESLQASSSVAEPHVIWISGIQPYSIPWYTVSSREEWLQAIESMASRNATHFYLIAAPSFAEELRSDEGLLKRLEARSPMTEWRLSFSDTLGRYEFSDVVFSAEPRVECETAESLVEAIRQMGASGISSFNLILSQELYETVSGSNFEKLHALEADAGMSSCELSYNPGLCVLMYSSAVIHSNAVKLTTVQEVESFLARSVAEREESITLFCTPELFAFLIGDITSQSGTAEQISPISDAFVLAGLFKYSFTYSQASCLITVKVEKVYPGTSILAAVAADDVSFLTGREKEALAVAQKLAAECRMENDLQTALMVHDSLCRIIHYTTDNISGEGDTAVGALLNGQADCDGYADAFYLVGSLAGLKVRYQHGDSFEKDPDESYSGVTHMWNLLQINSTWRLVDVTWDDQEDRIVYNWFNIGADRARLMHIWNEEMTVPLLPETDLSERPGNEYLVRNASEAGGAAKNALSKGASSFTLVFPDEKSMVKEEVLDMLRTALRCPFSYEWNEYMHIMNISLISE